MQATSKRMSELTNHRISTMINNYNTDEQRLTIKKNLLSRLGREFSEHKKQNSISQPTISQRKGKSEED